MRSHRVKSNIAIAILEKLPATVSELFDIPRTCLAAEPAVSLS